MFAVMKWIYLRQEQDEGVTSAVVMSGDWEVHRPNDRTTYMTKRLGGFFTSVKAVFCDAAINKAIIASSMRKRGYSFVTKPVRECRKWLPPCRTSYPKVVYC
jgi:hypothetical protein